MQLQLICTGSLLKRRLGRRGQKAAVDSVLGRWICYQVSYKKKKMGEESVGSRVSGSSGIGRM